MINLPLEPFFVFLMIFVRFGFILSFFPVLGEAFVPVRVRIILSLMVAAALTPVAPVTADQFPSGLGGIIAFIVTEGLLGFSVAMIGRILFSVVQFSGQMAGEQMGFGLVNAIDPTGSHQISVVAEMQYILSLLVFLTADLHHTLFRVVAHSFEVLPPGAGAMNAGVTDFMMRLGSTLFELALRFAMPVIVIIFAINVSLGMIARGVPQLNVFLESFPLRIIAGVSVMMLTLGFTVNLWEGMFSNLEPMMMRMVRLMSG
jgi:flagellar biosynthetic protein FliR